MKSILFTFCGFLAYAAAHGTCACELTNAQVSASANPTLNAAKGILNRVTDQVALSQSGAIANSNSHIDEFLGFGGCDDCDDICDHNHLGTPHSQSLSGHQVTTQDTVIPVITLSTRTDTVTDGCHKYDSAAESTTLVDNEYSVCGSLKTSKFNNVQELSCDDDGFSLCGESHSCLTNCGHGGEHECECDEFAPVEVADPEADISARVAK